MKELVIGVGDGAVSRDAETMLITYALGSCIALMVHDPVARVAGMAHYMLPESPQSQAEHDTRPYKFADTAIPLLLRAALAQGADRRRLVVFAAGGAQVMNDNSIFNVGKRNCLALRKALWKFGLVAHAEDIGGTLVRTVRMEVGSGRVWLQSPAGKRWEMSARGPRAADPGEGSSWR
ncbi:MAG TPA: chemotaxis protein CheD [Terracidiphilus sp.]|jgi:chemotaxis protein CheD|nr:chemotaxis protein CheD [Terracidiphilus sp.]